MKTKDTARRALAAQLRAARLAAGLSQAELAARAGIAQPVIATLESGKHVVSDERLAQLFDLCGYDYVVTRTITKRAE